ncbi:PREDICTED: uncharacterized protein LOC104606705 [Nelumbo nucifera]|uniref:Uncharacterized protein n=2 Tax=Nelumbo nucifera TaxID=4432 RepID=A0A822Z468_NELNU|nr:PREDICTED: uncharacterized protein LOC104606705 [Nelumbo nucifera]DAD39852.1 TPA_asm: hypothetical protein HUJ06_014175 [Nelumbo nucifera]
MHDLRREPPRNLVYSSNSKQVGRTQMDFGVRVRRTAQNYENYGRTGGSAIEFGTQTQVEDDESGVSSPPLWKTSSPPSPTEAAPLHPRRNHHHHYQYLSPTSRSQAIARGRWEMVEMIQNMPESNYELSLKDIVEKPVVQAVEQVTVDENGDLNNGRKMKKEQGARNGRRNDKKGILRTESMDRGVFLLNMFFPTSMGSKKKKKSSITGNCSKVSPRPSLEGSERGVDKDWWKKRFSVSGEADDGGTNSNCGSKGSAGSSGRSSGRSSRRNSIKSGQLGGCLPVIWPFNTKESKTRYHNESPF